MRAAKRDATAGSSAATIERWEDRLLMKEAATCGGLVENRRAPVEPGYSLPFDLLSPEHEGIRPVSTADRWFRLWI
jgi:hypothetical protein